jgi:amino acid adenylation domain-containing protein
VAVTSETKQLTYRDLSQAASDLAGRLRQLGAGPELVVGILLDRSPELLTALLAVAMAGAAYVPLDPDSPPERLVALLDQSQAIAAVTQLPLAGKLADWARPVIMAARAAAPAGLSRREPRPRPRAGGAAAAYLIYTSGSTGTPKGVVVSHAALLNELAAMQDCFHLGAGDTVLLKTPVTFDVSVWETFWPLLHGARIAVAAPGGHLDPLYLARTIDQCAVTTVQFVPTMLRAFLDAGARELPSLRQVLCIGEALPHDLQQQFFRQLPGVRLYNLYGPAEATVHVTQWECHDDPAGRVVPIGRPIAHTTARVLDDELNPLPPGETGRLYLGGAGVARGYAGAPGLTARRFRPDPFSREPGQRLYATGDLARLRPDGVAEFAGRIDHQVKVRGHRVEPGEVEWALTSLPEIREALVVAVPDPRAGTELAAYVTLAPAGALLREDGGGPPAEGTTARLRRALRATLPEHLVPTRFVILADLPRSANGKLDRTALPAAGRAAVRRRFVPPRTKVEADLSRIWEQALDAARVGIDDDFYALGGHSMLMLQIVGQVRETLGVSIPPLTLAQSPRLADFAEHVTRALADPAPAAPGLARAPASERRPLSSAEHRLWVIDQLEPGTARYASRPTPQKAAGAGSDDGPASVDCSEKHPMKPTCGLVFEKVSELEPPYGIEP